MFKSCSGQYLDEQRLYRRDAKGKIVKENDHIMDAERYGLMADGFIKSIKAKEVPRNERYIGARSHSGGWMG